jgi:hypothetical protein
MSTRKTEPLSLIVHFLLEHNGQFDCYFRKPDQNKTLIEKLSRQQTLLMLVPMLHGRSLWAWQKAKN